MSVTAKFSLEGEVREFSSDGDGGASAVGSGTAPSAPKYSGKHDHGDLPALRAESDVVLSLRAAKADSDAFLSAAIESAKLSKGEGSDTQVAKKPRR